MHVLKTVYSLYSSSFSFITSSSPSSIQEGLGPQQLDKYSKSYGFPVGLATLADEVGLDVAYHVAQDLGSKFGSRLGGADINVLKDLIEQGFLGE